MDLTGKVAIVTGSSSGIGAAIARRFAADGAAVVVNSSSSVTAGEALAAELPQACYVQADVREERQCVALVAAALEQWGRLDIVVNNAGWTQVIAHDDLDGATDDVWHRILDTNVLGPWYLTRAAVPALRDTGDGCVINMSSLAGVRVAGSSVPYAVSKAALNHMTPPARGGGRGNAPAHGLMRRLRLLVRAAGGRQGYAVQHDDLRRC